MNSQELEFILKMRDEASAILKKVGGGFDDGAEGAEKFSREGKKASNTLDNIMEKAKQATAVLSGFGTSTVLIGKSVSAWNRYEMGITGVVKTTNFAGKELDLFRQKFDALDRRMNGISTQGLAELSETVGQIGVKGVDDILAMTEVLAKLGVTSDVAGQQGATMVARILNLTGEGAKGARQFGDVLNYLGNNVAAREGEILDMAAAVAQATAEFGMSSKQILGLSAASRELDLNFEVTGAAFGRVLRNLRDGAASGTRSFQQFLDIAGLTEAQFRQLLKEDPSQILLSFADTYSQLTASGQSAPFLEALGLNTDEIKRVFGTIGANVEGFKRTLALTEGDGFMGALDREAEMFFAAQQNELEALKKAWASLFATIGEALSPITGPLIDLATSALNALQDVIDALPSGFSTLLAAVVVLLPAFMSLKLAISLVGGVLGLLGVGFSGAAAGAGIFRLAMIAFGTVFRFVLGPIGLVISGIALVASTMSASEDAAKSYASQLQAATRALKDLDEARTTFSNNRSTQTRQAWVDAVTTAKEEAEKLVEEAQKNLDQVREKARWDGGLLMPDSAEELAAISAAEAAVTAAKNRVSELDAELSAAETAMVDFGTAAEEALGIVSFSDKDIELFKKFVPGPQEKQQLVEFGKLLEKLNQSTDEQIASFGISREDLERAQRLYDIQKAAADDPVGMALTGYLDEIVELQDLTGAQKALLEIEQETLRIVEETGESYEVVKKRVQEVVGEAQKLRQTQAIKETLDSLDEQIAAVGEVTAEARMEAQIREEILKITQDNLALDEAQAAAIAEKVRRLYEAKKAAAFDEAIRSAQEQLEIAQATTQAERDRLEVKRTIAEFEKQNGVLDPAQRAQYEALLLAQKQADAWSALQGILDPIGEATRQYEASLQTLNAALASGTITTQQYNEMLGRLNEQTLSQRDPYAAQMRSIQDAMEATKITGEYREADVKTLQTITDLQRQGVSLTDQQKEAMLAANRALQDAQNAQNTGIRAFIDSIPSMKEALGELTTDFASGLAGAIKGALKGEQDAFLNFISNIAGKLIDTGVDQMIKGMFDKVEGKATAAGGKAGGGFGSFLKDALGIGGATPANTNAAPQDAIAGALSSMATGTMNVTAASVIVSGGSGFTEGQNVAFSTSNQNYGPAGAAGGYGGGSGAAAAGTAAMGMGGYGPGSTTYGGGGRDAGNSLGPAVKMDQMLTLSPQEIIDLKKTVATEWVQSAGDAQAQGIIDTILNRKASGKWGPTITDVVNAKSQFSDINGRPAWQDGRNSVDDLPMSRIDPRTDKIVDDWLKARSMGAPSSIGDHLNYANPNFSDASNLGWINALEGPVLGRGNAIHRHGTTPDLQGVRPGAFGIQLPGQGVGMGSIEAQLASVTPMFDKMGASIQGMIPALQAGAPAANQFGSGIEGLLLALAGGGGQGGGGFNILTLLGGMFHEGGKVGAGRPKSGTRRLPASAWLGAPRFHNGLQSDEYTAILQRGERVLTGRDNARTERVIEGLSDSAEGGGRRQGRSVVVNYNVYTPDAGSFHRTEKQQKRSMSRSVARASSR